MKFVDDNDDDDNDKVVIILSSQEFCSRWELQLNHYPKNHRWF